MVSTSNMFPRQLVHVLVTSPDHQGHQICPAVTFFLWEHLKERVYTHKPWTLINLKQAIKEEVQSIQPNIC